MKEIIEKINDLYIIKRSKYLILSEKGNYVTFDTNSGNDKIKPLTDYTVHRHLQGKSTLGVFATKRATKFICFDVDVKDNNLAKWTVYKLVDGLSQLGINSEYINISTSGNKGYHVELFFSEPIENYIVKQFYLTVLNMTDLLNINYGQVELRPTAEQGVKLPLGINFKNSFKRKCYFVKYENELKPIKNNNYILKIEKIDAGAIYDILQREKDNLLEADVIEVDKADEYIDKKYKPLTIYKQNVEEKETIEAIEEILYEGLKQTGTRNNSLFKLAKYFKYKGLNQEQNKKELINWLEWQDKNKYTTKWEQCLKEIDHIVNYIYEKDIQLTFEAKKISIVMDEMKEIIHNCKSLNEKLLTYCLLIHSKRYANAKGVFYMTYEQMAKASGLDLRTTKRLIPKLDKMGIITIVQRDTRQEKSYKHKPNKYKINIKIDFENSNVFNLVDLSDSYSTSFKSCLIYLFKNDELKKLLPRRQYSSVVGL